MPVRTVELTAIEAKRFTKSTEKVGQFRIDHNSTVTFVREASTTEASVEFRYTASYGSLGIIKMEGTLSFTGDAHALTTTWQQSSQMPGDIASEIHTAVMRVCVPEAVGIAKNLQLPPPIPLPVVRFDQPPPGQKPGAPTHSPEFA